MQLLAILFTTVCIAVCRSKAKKLNRNVISWTVFAFFLPLIAIIWIQFMKKEGLYKADVRLEKDENLLDD